MSFSRPSPLKVCVGVYALIYLAIVIHSHPSRTDPPEAIHFQPTPEQQVFCDGAFASRQARYDPIAPGAAEHMHIRDQHAKFVADSRLGGAHALDVGSGAGLLQDVVADYTGLDISATARSRYHKRFVQADARAMPFPDGEFDLV
jgi:ubiquinone/menaquinone biosynthesis C-methylase UbiE